MKQIERFGIEMRKDKYKDNAVYGIVWVYSLIDKMISDYLRPYDLTVSKFNALMVIKHIGKEKGISQVQIGKQLIVTASNMTRLVDRMAREGYIECVNQEGDRRVNLVKISQKGSDILDKAWPGYKEKLKEITSVIKDNKLEQLSNLVVEWARNLEEG